MNPYWTANGVFSIYQDESTGHVTITIHDVPDEAFELLPCHKQGSTEVVDWKATDLFGHIEINAVRARKFVAS